MPSADPTDEDSRPARWWIAGLVAVVLLILTDVVMDAGEGADPLHMALEVTASLTLGVILLAMLRRREARIGALQLDLDRTRREAERWRVEANQALQGLGEAIDKQFGRWELTRAEGEVALLLLKGLSFKEIGEVRGTSERTVRDQARSVYRKAGLSGRSELSAFFLEDLLLPTPDP